jgi:uncharacterized membrane protein YsdA (DUF1294 family)
MPRVQLGVDAFLSLSIRNLLLWLGGWSLVGLILMGEDKDQAVMQEHADLKERIGERTLHEVALIGGFLGIIIGAKIFHHKTSKRSFWPPVATSIFVWILLLYLVVGGNLKI